MEFIDAHHHLWDLSRVEYPWLMARGEVRFFGQPDPIRRDYLLSDYLADTDGRILRRVHVQVGARPEHELRETEFVAECSQASEGRFPAGAVVALDCSQDDIRRDLDAQLEHGVTRGVRHMIGKSPEENPTLPPFVPDRWVPNWEILARRGLPFDLQLTEDQYPAVLEALRRVPDLKVAICHLASPWDRSLEGFRRWREWMGRFAELPNTVMKISGLSMFTHRWEADTFMDYGLASLEAFGADRCMLGSNFPVDRLYVSYDDLFAAWEQLLDECTETEAAQLAGATAAAFYRL